MAALRAVGGVDERFPRVAGAGAVDQAHAVMDVVAAEDAERGLHGVGAGARQAEGQYLHGDVPGRFWR